MLMLKTLTGALVLALLPIGHTAIDSTDRLSAWVLKLSDFSERIETPQQLSGRSRCAEDSSGAGNVPSRVIVLWIN